MEVVLIAKLSPGSLAYYHDIWFEEQTKSLLNIMEGSASTSAGRFQFSNKDVFLVKEEYLG